jgi:hypothetical protein
MVCFCNSLSLFCVSVGERAAGGEADAQAAGAAAGNQAGLKSGFVSFRALVAVARSELIKSALNRVRVLFRLGTWTNY